MVVLNHCNNVIYFRPLMGFGRRCFPRSLPKLLQFILYSCLGGGGALLPPSLSSLPCGFRCLRTLLIKAVKTTVPLPQELVFLLLETEAPLSTQTVITAPERLFY